MADCDQDIDAYLKGDGKGQGPFFAIFSDWTPQDYEVVCSRIENACIEVGISLRGHLPRFSVRNGRVANNTGYRQRIAVENLLFGRYNHDELFSMPHQKDPSIPRPSWFQDYMLTPGPHSIGQKLLLVGFRRNKDRITGRRRTQTEDIEQAGQQVHRRSPPAESQNTLITQDLTSMSSASAEERMTTVEQSSHLDAASNIECEIGGDAGPGLVESLTIHIGTIVELDQDQLLMRRTLRDPHTWFESSTPGVFDFEKVCQSIGITAGWEKELYFFPDLSKDPHNILDGDELHGAVRCLYKQSVKEGMSGNTSLFVAADMSHVRELSLDQRMLPKQTAQTVTVRQRRQ